MEILEHYEFWKFAHIYYIIIINTISLVLFGIDKNRAIKKEMRIRELTFIVLAIFGGTVGILIGMVIFKHKLKKKKFYFGIPFIYLLNKIIEIIFWITLSKNYS